MNHLSKTVIIDIVGLCQDLLGKHTPFLNSIIAQHGITHIRPALPAVTCTAQMTYLTGTYPRDHGIVGNGWYFQDEAEIRFWKQSNHLVQGQKIWDEARTLDPTFTVANLFWWYNMYSTVDYSVTPRPMYPADGRKIPDIYTAPAELRSILQDQLGQFPLFKFWGPATSIEVSRWISRAARIVDQRYHPTLSLIYIPHLDYNTQRFGPDHPSVDQDLQEVDDLIRDLYEYYDRQGSQVVLLSEYGINPVTEAIHPNRILRKAGLLSCRTELGKELLDAGASEAFAVADHQIAHVYLNNQEKAAEVRNLLEGIDGIDQVLDKSEQSAYQLNHLRSGDFVLLAKEHAWFTYYYWLDDAKAPDFSRTVDIHRKPGYDPVEMFLDPAIRFPRLKMMWKLLLRKLGSRTLMDVIPLKAELVGGSHGHLPKDKRYWPVLISNSVSSPEHMQAHEVYHFILRCLNR